MLQYILEPATAENTVFQAVSACCIKGLAVILLMQSYQKVTGLIIDLRGIRGALAGEELCHIQSKVVG